MKPRPQLNPALHPVLLSILDGATNALANWDAEQLENLVQGSRDLLAPGAMPMVASAGMAALPELPAPLRQKLDTFARLLDLTRENLILMRRRGEPSAAQIEYTPASLAGGRHGNN